MGSSMMNGWGWGMMSGSGLVMIFFLVLIALGIVALLKFIGVGRRK